MKTFALRSSPPEVVLPLEAAAQRPASLVESYRICEELHRQFGTTYYWATRSLPKFKQHHVHALYGLCRYADEIVDSAALAGDHERRLRLKALRDRLSTDLVAGQSSHPVISAVVFTARAWNLDPSVFTRFFDSMEMDLDIASYETFDDLSRYVDGSAAVIGEMMFPILEPLDDGAFAGARDLGIAFQLTNFLRDVGEDLDRGRVYFPQDELALHDADVHSRQVTQRWRDFCEFQIDRIERLYENADEAIELLPPESARSIRAARILYSEILLHIRKNDYDVFERRARVSMPRKIGIAGRALVGR